MTLFRHLAVFTAIFICSFSGWAQITNLGDMVLSENTTATFENTFKNKENASFVNSGESIFRRNLENDGNWDHDGTSATTRIDGSNIQLIDGSEPIFFNSLVVNNTATTGEDEDGVWLDADIFVGSQMRFANGIMNNRDYEGTLVFQQNSTANGATDNSHFNGTAEYNGAGNFVFPIGDKGRFREAGIVTSNSSDHIVATYFLGNPTEGGFNTENKDENVVLVNNTEYWEVTSNNSNAVDLTLGWNSSTTSADVLSNTSQIGIVRWNTGSSQWEFVGGEIDLANGTVTAEVGQFGAYTLGTVIREIENVDNCLQIFNAVTPNGDFLHDSFKIKAQTSTCISGPVNVIIFNRWGHMIYETDDYGIEVDGNLKNPNVFTGESQAELTINKEDQLPTGTYFYIINYSQIEDGEPVAKSQSGYLFFNNGKD